MTKAKVAADPGATTSVSETKRTFMRWPPDWASAGWPSTASASIERRVKKRIMRTRL